MTVNDWSLTRSEIISMALRLAGVLPTGDTTSSDFVTAQTDEAQNALNMIMRAMPLSPFKKKTFSAPLISSPIVTGTDGLNYKCVYGHTTVNSSTWASSTSYQKGAIVFPTVRAGYYFEAQKAGTSSGSEPTWNTLVENITTDNTVTWKCYADSKPITGAVYKQYWEEITTSGSAYQQNKEYRPINEIKVNSNIVSIDKIWYRKDTDDDYILKMVSRSEYNEINDKTETGDPILAFFDNQVSSIIRLWPVPDDTTKIIMYDGISISNDMDSGSDTLESTLNLKNRWTEYIVYALAVHLGEEYQLPESKLIRLERKKEAAYIVAMNSDCDIISNNFLKGAY